MRTTHFAFAAVAAVLLAFPVAASAQAPAAAPKLATGQWTGTVSPPDGSVVAVTFDVATTNDTLHIMINAAEHGNFAAEDIKVDASSVSFAFTPGPHVVCVLNKKDDASYAGNCSDDSGTAVPMTMVPPAKPAGTGD